MRSPDPCLGLGEGGPRVWIILKPNSSRRCRIMQPMQRPAVCRSCPRAKGGSKTKALTQRLRRGQSGPVGTHICQLAFTTLLAQPKSHCPCQGDSQSGQCTLLGLISLGSVPVWSHPSPGTGRPHQLSQRPRRTGWTWYQACSVFPTQRCQALQTRSRQGAPGKWAWLPLWMVPTCVGKSDLRVGRALAPGE